MPWENRPASMYGYFKDASDLGCLFHGPNHPGYSKLHSNAYAMPHGHCIHFATNDPGDNFPYTIMEEMYGDYLWASQNGNPVYYRSSLQIYGGTPLAPKDKWKRLTRFWDELFLSFFVSQFYQAQHHLTAEAIPVMVTDNGALESRWYCEVTPAGEIRPYEELGDALFVDRVAAFFRSLHEVGIRLVVNQASMEYDNWLKTHQWVFGTTSERILFWEEGGRYRWMQWMDKIKRHQHTQNKVNLFDVALRTQSDDEVFRGLLAYNMLRGPFDFCSMRYLGYPPKNYLAGLERIGTPIFPAQEIDGGYSRITTNGVIYTVDGQIYFVE